MRLQALVLLTAFAILTGLLHASLFITPPGYSTLVSNTPNACTAVIHATGGAIPSTQSGGALITSLPANSFGIGIALLALVLSIMIVAIVYMIGKVFPSSGLLGWVNQEYWEIAKSGLILLAIFALLIFMSNIAVAVTNTPVTAYSKTNTYLNNINGLLYSSETYLLTVDSYSAAGWCTLGRIDLGTALINSIKIEYYLPFDIFDVGLKFGFEFSPLTSATILAGSDPTISQLQSMFVDTIILLYYPLSMVDIVLIEILPILVWIGLGFFIPFGIFCRALPVIRPLGGTLIAIGIALSILLPSVLVMLNVPVTSVMQNVLPINAITSQNNACKLGNVVFDYACKGLNTVVGGISGIADSLIWGFSAFGGLYTILNVLIPYQLFMMLQEILLVLDIIIVYAIADNIAIALGGKMPTSIGGKFKLI
jgi:hypothetical protein